MAREGRKAGKVPFIGSCHFHWLELVVQVHLDVQNDSVFTAVIEVNGNFILNVKKKGFSCITRYPKVVITFFFNGTKIVL